MLLIVERWLRKRRRRRRHRRRSSRGGKTSIAAHPTPMLSAPADLDRVPRGARTRHFRHGFPDLTPPDFRFAFQVASSVSSDECK